MFQRDIKGKTHYVYGYLETDLNKVEQNKEHLRRVALEEMAFHFEQIPEIKDWRESEVNDWVWSDDNRICQIIYKNDGMTNKFQKSGKSKTKGYVKTIIGCFVINKYVFMDTNPGIHKNRHVFSTSEKVKKIDLSKPLNLTQKKFALKLAIGKNPVDAYIESHQNAKSTSLARIEFKASKLLKDDRIFNLAMENMRQIAKDLGINREYILRGYRDMYERASVDLESTGSVAVQSLDRLVKLTGLDKEDGPVLNQVESQQIFSKEESKQIEAKQMIVSSEIERLKANQIEL